MARFKRVQTAGLITGPQMLGQTFWKAFFWFL